MILLADRVVGGVEGQVTFGGLDITVRRNAFGRQVDSFESDLSFNGESLHAIFIRAPWVEDLGPEVEVLSTAADHPVAIRQGSLLATSFHPELTANHAVHRFFFETVCKGR
jgi:5'-phosphate synthase pdxT subunit